MRLEISTSCSRVSSGTWPICLQIHADRVVQDVQPALVLLLLRFGLLDAVHLGLVHDFDFQVAQLGVKIVQVLGRHDAVGQRVVDVVVGQVALFLRQADQFLDLFGQVQRRTWRGGWDR